MGDKWLKDEHGFYLSPGKQKSVYANNAKKYKKHKTNGDKYTGRKLKRLCPKCGKVITIERYVHRNDKYGIMRDMKVYICEKCNAVWSSKQTIKVWERLKSNPPKMSNREFKSKL